MPERDSTAAAHPLRGSLTRTITWSGRPARTSGAERPRNRPPAAASGVPPGDSMVGLDLGVRSGSSLARHRAAGSRHGDSGSRRIRGNDAAGVPGARRDLPATGGTHRNAGERRAAAPGLDSGDPGGTRCALPSPGTQSANRRGRRRAPDLGRDEPRAGSAPGRRPTPPAGSRLPRPADDSRKGHGGGALSGPRSRVRKRRCGCRRIRRPGPPRCTAPPAGRRCRAAA